jgi:hypothetical protein
VAQAATAMKLTKKTPSTEKITCLAELAEVFKIFDGIRVTGDLQDSVTWGALSHPSYQTKFRLRNRN